jgi:hypothetical protein
MFCTTFSHYFTTFVGVGAKVEATVDVARPVVIVNRVVLAGTKLGGAEEKIFRATERLRCEYRDLAGRQQQAMPTTTLAAAKNLGWCRAIARLTNKSPTANKSILILV